MYFVLCILIKHQQSIIHSEKRKAAAPNKCGSLSFSLENPLADFQF